MLNMRPSKDQASQHPQEEGTTGSQQTRIQAVH